MNWNLLKKSKIWNHGLKVTTCNRLKTILAKIQLKFLNLPVFFIKLSYISNTYRLELIDTVIV